MVTKEASRLCGVILHNDFGIIVSKVGRVVLEYGRLPLPLICSYAELKPKQVRSALLIMIQHNIMWHCSSPDNSEIYFECNSDEILSRIRFGRYIRFCIESFKDEMEKQCAGEIITNILLNGKLKSLDLLNDLPSYMPLEVSRKVLVRLVSTAAIVPSTPNMHISPRDKILIYEKEIKASRYNKTSILGPKDIKFIKEHSQLKLDEEYRAERGDVKEEDGLRVGMKRKKSSNKRSRDDDIEIDENIYFRVNYEHFNAKLRNRLIAAEAGRRWNEQTGFVMDAFLKATEEKQSSLSDPHSEPVALHQVAKHIPSNANLKKGIVVSSKDLNVSKLINEYCQILSSQDCPGPLGSQNRFLMKSSNNKEYHVAYETVCARIKRSLVDSLVREQFGPEAARIVNIVLDKGKLEEKHIATIGLLTMKETRETIAKLQKSGLLQLQEVPKSTDRAVHKTFYLWYVDLPKAYLGLCSKLYKTIGNLIERKFRERKLRYDVLVRADRSDVRQDLNLLARSDKERLDELRRVIEMLEVAVLRSDAAIFTLRDLPGGPSSQFSLESN